MAPHGFVGVSTFVVIAGLALQPGFGQGRGGGTTTGGTGTTTGGNTSRTPQEQRLLDCELRARLAGYRSQSLSLANHRPMDPPDVGTILLHRMGASEGTTVSMASLAAPKDAKKAFDKGMEALK